MNDLLITADEPAVRDACRGHGVLRGISIIVHAHRSCTERDAREQFKRTSGLVIGGEGLLITVRNSDASARARARIRVINHREMRTFRGLTSKHRDLDNADISNVIIYTF